MHYIRQMHINTYILYTSNAYIFIYMRYVKCIHIYIRQMHTYKYVLHTSHAYIYIYVLYVKYTYIHTYYIRRMYIYICVTYVKRIYIRVKRTIYQQYTSNTKGCSGLWRVVQCIAGGAVCYSVLQCVAACRNCTICQQYMSRTQSANNTRHVQKGWRHGWKQHQQTHLVLSRQHKFTDNTDKIPPIC